jgi:hypothetical protein
MACDRLKVYGAQFIDQGLFKHEPVGVQTRAQLDESVHAAIVTPEPNPA